MALTFAVLRTFTLSVVRAAIEVSDSLATPVPIRLMTSFVVNTLVALVVNAAYCVAWSAANWSGVKAVN